jgi:hypothetical protein
MGAVREHGIARVDDPSLMRALHIIVSPLLVTELAQAALP